MPDISANLSLPYILPSQAQKHVTHNEALRMLDTLVQLSVEDRTLTVPPASPDEGAAYIVGAAATGDWAGQDAAVAVFETGGWRFLAPRTGWKIYDIGQEQSLIYRSGSWQVPLPETDNLPGIGINTSADSTNRLSLSSPATMLSHEGGGHQVKVNKASSGDTASLLFQTGWSGRAEMGTTSGDDFVIKTSPDGIGWTSALSVGSDGLVTGAAVQSTPTDNGAGKILQTGAFGLGSRLQSAEVTIPDDGVAALVPPNNGGFAAVTSRYDTSFPQLGEGGLLAFDTGPSPSFSVVWAGSSFAVAVAGTVLNGTTGDDGKTTVSLPGDGTLQIENRNGQSTNFKITWL